MTASRPRDGVLTRMRVSYFPRSGTQKTETLTAHRYPATSSAPAYRAWYETGCLPEIAPPGGCDR